MPLNTVAANAKIRLAGLTVGLISDLSWDHAHGTQAAKGIGSPTAAAIVPGFQDVTFRFSEAQLQAFRITEALTQIQPHSGQNFSNSDFTQLYFDIQIFNADGSPFQTLHDCMLQAQSISMGVNQNIIMKSGSGIARYLGTSAAGDLGAVATIADTLSTISGIVNSLSGL